MTYTYPSISKWAVLLNSRSLLRYSRLTRGDSNTFKVSGFVIMFVESIDEAPRCPYHFAVHARRTILFYAYKLIPGSNLVRTVVVLFESLLLSWEQTEAQKSFIVFRNI